MFTDSLKSFMFFVARSRLAGFLVSGILAHMSFLIPGERLRETDTLLAMRHPRPGYPVHILLLPKRPYPTLLALQTNDTAFLADLLQTVQSLVIEFDLEAAGYRLITNGGPYQDVPHLHFHLISENGKIGD